MSKKELRDHFQEKRKSIRDRERRENEMVKALLIDERVNCSKVISVFVSFGSEINTHGLIEALLSVGKRVVIPSIDESDKMVMKEIKFLDDLDVIGRYGIKETSSPAVLEKTEIDLMIVPGLAFDKQKYRLGYGKGYYDGYLEGSNMKTIGLGFLEQAIDELPADSWDIPLDDVLLF